MCFLFSYLSSIVHFVRRIYLGCRLFTYLNLTYLLNLLQQCTETESAPYILPTFTLVCQSDENNIKKIYTFKINKTF